MQLIDYEQRPHRIDLHVTAFLVSRLIHPVDVFEIKVNFLMTIQINDYWTFGRRFLVLKLNQ